MNNLDIEKLKQTYDSAGMYDIIKNFPAQARQAVEIGGQSPKFYSKPETNNFAILGMGGSAIGGSVLKSYFNALEGAGHLNINIFRNYRLPKHVDKNYSVITCSYSGNTEETLSATEDARKVTDKIYCITSGGKLKSIAESGNLPAAIIPGGFQPRCALAYSIFPLISVFINNGLISREAIHTTENAIEELMPLLEKRAAEYSDFNSKNNIALDLAKKLFRTIPVIYSAEERLDSINIRWRNQIQENAKNPAFGGFLPEMNHNEVNGWTITENGLPLSAVSNFSAIILRDAADNPRISLRYEFLKSILHGKVKNITELEGQGKYLLTRMIDLIYLADWVSYYMALMNHTDPTPIPMINDLKDLLEKN